MSMLNESWTEAVARLSREGVPYTVATIIATSGSVPRASGTKMVICGEHTYATIGGGGLEFLVIQRARELLLTGTDCQEIKQFPLAAQARQCCGGSVTVLLECFPSRLQPVVIFGAGHVTRALSSILQELPCRTLVIDKRRDLLDELACTHNVQTRFSENPETEIPALPAQSCVLVLTHNHALDYRLVKALLEQGEWRYLGLIGSATKARRFRMRLEKDAINPEALARLECPLGLPEIRGKLPMEVAVSISARILTLLAQDKQVSGPPSGNWREMKTLLKQARAMATEK